MSDELKENNAKEYWARAEEHRVKWKEYHDKGCEYWGWAYYHRLQWKEYWSLAEEEERKEKSREAGDE